MLKLDYYFDYPQHIFWSRNKNNNFQVHTAFLSSESTDTYQNEYCWK